jgi:hypothetical protein
MASREKPKPGEIRITVRPPHSSITLQAPSKLLLGAILLGLVVFGILLLFVNQSGSVSDSSHASSSQIAGKYVTLPPRPALEGKYAALVRRGKSTDSLAIAFANTRIEIVQVSEVPPAELSLAVHWPVVYSHSESSNEAIFERIVKGDQDAAKIAKSVGPLTTEEEAALNEMSHLDGVLYPDEEDAGKPSYVVAPLQEAVYVLHGDIGIAMGDLVNNDQLVTDLITKRGDLKAANITIIDGSPRGPPSTQSLATRGTIKVYVVGKVKQLNLPELKDKSSLYASVLDLSPTESQFDKYISELSIWHDKVKVAIGDHKVRVSDLWDSRAGRGLRLKIPEESFRVGEGYYRRMIDEAIPEQVEVE